MYEHDSLCACHGICDTPDDKMPCADDTRRFCDCDCEIIKAVRSDEQSKYFTNKIDSTGRVYAISPDLHPSPYDMYLCSGEMIERLVELENRYLGESYGS